MTHPWPVALEHERSEIPANNAIFAPFIYKNRSFYQDRLGTNIGKALKKRWSFSLRNTAASARGCTFRRKRISFLNFSCVCPEHVVVNRSVFCIKSWYSWLPKGVFSRTGSDRHSTSGPTRSRCRLDSRSTPGRCFDQAATHRRACPQR